MKNSISTCFSLLTAAVAGVGAAKAAAPAPAKSATPARPNILYIMTDHYTTGAFSYMGNPYVKTPNLDRLAKEGHFFNNAYCAFPLSTPSRGAIITARMPVENRIDLNRLPMPAEFEATSLGRVLKDGGYDAAWCGKWHVGNLDEAKHGFRDLGRSDDQHIADVVIGFLKEQHDKPFFVSASYTNPHNICQYARNQPAPNLITPKDVPTDQCPDLPANFAPSSFEPEAIRWEQRANPSNYGTVTWDDAKWRHYLHYYYRLIEEVDMQIGKILTAMRELGLEDKTIIIFTSDHGDGMGAHRWNQKTVLYDEVAKIPFIVRLPNKAGAGKVHDQLVSNALDFMPTLCDYAGITPPTGLDGVSIRPILDGKVAGELREYVPVQTTFGENAYGFGTKGWTIRTPHYKYTIYDKWGNREQFFDMDKDPGEMVNLADSERYAGERDRHRRILWQWAIDHKDSDARGALKDLCPEFILHPKMKSDEPKPATVKAPKSKAMGGGKTAD